MFRPLVPHVHRLIQGRKLSFIFVDVGSRGGVLDLRDIASDTVAYGFEPDAEEHAKLMSGVATDAWRRGLASPRYRKLTYLPYAIGDFCGTGQLYITRNPMACGLLEPDLERLREIRWKGRSYQPNFGDNLFQVVRTEPIRVRTLEWFAREQAIEHVDYLKVDVEGSEYEALAGAGDLLRAISVIKVEVCFIPFRKDQKLFSHVDLLLRDHGFDLLRYEVLPTQVGYKERRRPFNYGPALGFPDPYGQPVQGEAVYVNRNMVDENRAAAQAVVLMEKNYLDEALFILKRKVRDVDPALLDLLREYSGNVRSRLVEAAVWWYRHLWKLRHPVRWVHAWARQRAEL